MLTSEGTNTTTYVALATAGPSVTVPLAGDYTVEIGSHISGNQVSTGGYHSYDVGGTAASDNDAHYGFEPSVGVSGGWNGNRKRPKTGVLAGSALVSKYRAVGVTTATFEQRWISVLPIRVG